jgi:hypothetical protein
MRTRVGAQAKDASKRARTHKCTLAGHAWKAPMDKVLQLSIELSRAVSFLHNCNPPIIHRDLKPANLLLTASGRLKVCARAGAATRAISRTVCLVALPRRVRWWCVPGCAGACVPSATQLEAPTTQRARAGCRRMQRPQQRPQTLARTLSPSHTARRAWGAGVGSSCLELTSWLMFGAHVVHVWS